MAGGPVGRTRRRSSSERPRSCARGASSSRRSRSSRPASRSPRPTPTCARRSTSASTTDGRHSASRAGAPHRPGAGREPTRTPTSRAAIGVVISPWNFPLAIPTGMVTAALVTGNAVLFKPAEQTPGVALRLVEVLHEAGVPPGVLAFLPGVGEEVGAYLVEHPAVAFVAFTGLEGASACRSSSGRPSSDPGSDTSSASWPRWAARTRSSSTPTPTSTSRSRRSSHSAFAYAGQKCSAASRVIALDPVFDELVERAGRRGADRSGRAGRRSCAPCADRSSTPTRTNACGDTSRWRATRARSSSSATTCPTAGGIAGPTVVVTDDPRARIATDEIFGPVLTMLRADDFDHAARARQRHRLRPHRRTVLALAVAHRARDPVAAGGERLREPGHHGRARRPSAVRGLRALRRRLEGGRARLPAAVRRIPRGHREHHPAGLRTTAGRTRDERDQAGCCDRCSIVASAPG